MGTAFGYVTSKEVVVAPWYKKPDVELQDASGYLLIVPRSVLYARISMNRRNSGKRKREENSDYLYFKTLPNVVKVYPFSVLNVISKHRS